MLSGAEATFSVRMDGAEAWLMKAFRARMRVPKLVKIGLNSVSDNLVVKHQNSSR